MARIAFTSHLRRHLDLGEIDITCQEGDSLASLLDTLFTQQPRVKSYLLEDQGGLRKHITLFINGEPIKDRARLSDPVPAQAEIYVMQALSGG